MHLHPLFWWQLGSFLNIPAIIRTMLFFSSDCRIDGSKSGLPYNKQLHKSSVAHWKPIILDMPHSPTGSVLAFEHPKDLGRQVAILGVQRLLMNKDVDIWAGTPTYSSFSSFVIFASSFRVSSHLSHLVKEVLIGAKQSPLQPHFELIKFLNLTGFTVCKLASCKAFWCFTNPGLLALFAGGNAATSASSSLSLSTGTSIGTWHGELKDHWKLELKDHWNLEVWLWKWNSDSSLPWTSFGTEWQRSILCMHRELHQSCYQWGSCIVAPSLHCNGSNDIRNYWCQGSIWPGFHWDSKIFVDFSQIEVVEDCLWRLSALLSLFAAFTHIHPDYRSEPKSTWIPQPVLAYVSWKDWFL